MPTIEIEFCEIEEARAKMLRIADNMEEYAQKISSVANNLDMQILGKENIDDTLKKIQNTIAKEISFLEKICEALKSGMDDFIDSSKACESDAEKCLESLPKKRTHGGSSRSFSTDSQLQSSSDTTALFSNSNNVMGRIALQDYNF